MVLGARDIVLSGTAPAWKELSESGQISKDLVGEAR
jgi:hypothetical protein